VKKFLKNLFCHNYKLEDLVQSLAAVPGRHAPEQIETRIAQMMTVMGRTNHFDVLQSLSEVLAAMPGDRNLQQLIDLMKWPTCVGEVRAPLLTKLEQQTGQKFEGNVWNMVKWAQANGYDVTSPPRRPSTG